MLGFLIPDRFKIKRIKVSPSHPKLEQIADLKNQNLLFLNKEQAAANLSKANPEIEKLQLTKHYPDCLCITFVKSKPVAQIKTDGDYLLLNSKAKIIRKQNEMEANLLLINYYQIIREFESRPGQTIINQDLLSAVKIIAEAKKRNLVLETIIIDKPGQIRAQLKNKETTIIFSSKKNIAKSLEIVHNILRLLKAKGESPKEINLLFEKPIYTL